MVLDGSLMTVEVTAALVWKENNNHHKKADIEGYYSGNTMMNSCKGDSEVQEKLNYSHFSLES